MSHELICIKGGRYYILCPFLFIEIFRREPLHLCPLSNEMGIKWLRRSRLLLNTSFASSVSPWPWSSGHQPLSAVSQEACVCWNPSCRELNTQGRVLQPRGEREPLPNMKKETGRVRRLRVRKEPSRCLPNQVLCGKPWLGTRIFYFLCLLWALPLPREASVNMGWEELQAGG